MHLLYFHGLLCFYVLAGPSFLFCQTAEDNGPVPAATEKYIFYWSSFQCELTPATAYASQLRCTVAEFRQMLHSTPYLWTGTGMAEQLSFKLEGRPVRATRGGTDYQAQIGQLDEAFGQKVVAGQLLHITEIKLDKQTQGRIDVVLEDKSTKGTLENYRATPASNILNTQLLEQVIWGREDIYENSNRDFFSESEFWQTVQQLPLVEWTPYVNPEPIRAAIRFHAPPDVSFSLRAPVEPEAYRQMVESLQNYRHLVKPDAVIGLTLHTAQYDRLYEKNMIIVAKDDPRLALRRNRDTHNLKIKWGAWERNLDGLYLLELKNNQGSTVTTDLPVVARDMVMQSERAVMYTSRPECWIDGVPVPEMRFRIRMPGLAVNVGPDEAIPDTFRMSLDTNTQSIYQLVLDSFQVPGYAMPDLQFTLNFYYQRENLRVRNRLNDLLAAPGTALVQLHTPSPVGAGYAVELEILRESDTTFSIFKPDGENVFTLKNIYPPGRHTVEIPRLVFREPGKYYLFVNTVFGVAKQEVVLE